VNTREQCVGSRMAREKLLVERKAEELIQEVARLVKRAGHPCTASIHLEKAAVSTYLNIGEGTALYRPRLKANKYDIARGEANEVRRALEVLILQGKLTKEEVAAADKLADEIIAMLTTMIKNLEERG
jgi:four helix bundle protein